jgi:hypothetical protein
VNTSANQPVQNPDENAVLNCGDIHSEQLGELLAKFGLQLVTVAADQEIPGSWFGEREAGLIENRLYIRTDTPVHSALHESCHYICMDEQRRRQLHTNAGGDYAEENGVCYLQILLADHIDGFGRQRAFADMDAWGYSFRLGSSRAWFEQDAQDACDWLIDHGILDRQGQVTWKLRS